MFVRGGGSILPLLPGEKYRASSKKVFGYWSLSVTVSTASSIVVLAVPTHAQSPASIEASQLPSVTVIASEVAQKKLKRRAQTAPCARAISAHVR